MRANAHERLIADGLTPLMRLSRINGEVGFGGGEGKGYRGGRDEGRAWDEGRVACLPSQYSNAHTNEAELESNLF